MGDTDTQNQPSGTLPQNTSASTGIENKSVGSHFTKLLGTFFIYLIGSTLTFWVGSKVLHVLHSPASPPPATTMEAVVNIAPAASAPTGAPVVTTPQASIQPVTQPAANAAADEKAADTKAKPNSKPGSAFKAKEKIGGTTSTPYSPTAIPKDNNPQTASTTNTVNSQHPSAAVSGQGNFLNDGGGNNVDNNALYKGSNQQQQQPQTQSQQQPPVTTAANAAASKNTGTDAKPDAPKAADAVNSGLVRTGGTLKVLGDGLPLKKSPDSGSTTVESLSIKKTYNILGKIGHKTNVVIDGATAEDYWYLIKDPDTKSQGWVFGFYAKVKEKSN